MIRNLTVKENCVITRCCGANRITLRFLERKHQIWSMHVFMLWAYGMCGIIGDVKVRGISGGQRNV